MDWSNNSFSPLQAPFNQITYSMIGDDQTPSLFEINDQTGLISLRATADLTADSQVEYIVSMISASSLVSQFLLIVCVIYRLFNVA